MKSMPACPKCSKSDEVRQNLWGMPDSQVDETVFYVAGCVAESGRRKFICISCETEFGPSESDLGQNSWSNLE